MLTEEQLTEMLERMDDKELERMADNLLSIAKFITKNELKKSLARKLAKFEKRLARIERWQKAPSSVRKGLVGQDDESENDLWPSLDNLIL